MSSTSNAAAGSRQHHAKDYRFNPLLEAFIIGGSIFVIVIAVSYFIYYHATNAQKGEIREGLTRTVKTIATDIDGDMHKIFKTREQESSPEYIEFIKPLEKILAQDETIVFIYTTVMIDDEVYFVVDPTAEGDADGDGVDDKSHIMELYEGADDSLRTALKEQRALPTDEPYIDKWGSFMSAYAPFYDSSGEFVGVVGIDITADLYFERLAPMLRATARAMVAAFFVSFMVGALVWFMRNFTSVINARRIDVIEDLNALNDEVEKH